MQFPASTSNSPYFAPEEIAQSLNHLPSAPLILQRLNQLVFSGSLSLTQMGKLIRLDPGLSAQVLRLGLELSEERGMRCHCVEDAINLIGFERVHLLAAEVGDAQALSLPLGAYGLDADEAWRESISCALAAELLAEHTGDDISDAYTIGLLHNVGMWAINSWVSQHEPGLTFTPRGALRNYVECERSLLGCTQAEVGAHLLASWHFPRAVFDPVQWQQTPLGSGGYQRMACLLHVAKWLRTVVCTDAEQVPPPMPDAVILRPLRLTAERLGRMVIEVRVRLGICRNLIELQAA